MSKTKYDALIIGAGFGGIYQLYKLLQLGLSVILVETAGDVGGTWRWNRYPGAMLDTDARIYRFSWDTEDVLQCPCSKQPEVLSYHQYFVERHDLRKYMQFNTQLVAASYNEFENVWNVETVRHRNFTARYLFTDLGLLSKLSYPDIPCMEHFEGELYHTGNWPDNCDLSNKHVGIIGSGAIAAQVITAIAKDVRHLVSFQGHPQHSVSNEDGSAKEECCKLINTYYETLWSQMHNTLIKENAIPAEKIDLDGWRTRVEESWNKENKYGILSLPNGGFGLDMDINDEIHDLIQEKIRGTIKDPEKAKKLISKDRHAWAPLCNAAYYEQFNRENIDIVDLDATPITSFTQRGIKLLSGTEHIFDVIILATGFDIIDGSPLRSVIKGREGVTLKDWWKETGLSSYLGISIASFPNMFMILGPGSPFANIPSAVEVQVEFVTRIIEKAERKSRIGDSKSAKTPVIEVSLEAENEWAKICNEIASRYPFLGVNYRGLGNHSSNISTALFSSGGLVSYEKRIRKVAKNGYTGFKLRLSNLHVSYRKEDLNTIL
ncbi:cyclohexanone monooxygenase [Xylogone sp. PMI_703]|nr:cyclohexanone monooxygenase [Xylogone sp. PMI_703]